MPSDATQVQSLPLVVLPRHGEDSHELECEVVALFESYRCRLLAYVCAFGISSNDAEELVQEVFLALFCHLRMGKSRRNLPGWIFRVGHNLALKHRNASSALRQQADAEAASAARDHRLNPEEYLLSSRRRERLALVVDALPEQDRLCLMLRAEGLRYREIARILGISLGSVSASLTRTLARLTRADGQ